MIETLIVATLMSSGAMVGPDPHGPGDPCDCVYDVTFYTPAPAGPPIRISAPGVRVRGAPVFVPGPVIHVSAPPVYVDAPPVRVGAAQIHIERPDIRVRPSEVTIEPPVVSFGACPGGGSTCPAGRP